MSDSLAMASAGFLDPEREVLVGYWNGAYQRIDVDNGSSTFLGDLADSGITPRLGP